MSRPCIIALVLVVGLAPMASGREASSGTSAGRDIRLVWHVESPGGRVLASRGADELINPASVVKVATGLWALERLGPEHRFVTRFAARGRLHEATGVLEGDLVVYGGDDPDFHVENAYVVAGALNQAGLRTVRGRLAVDERFRIGWEGGSPGAGERGEDRARTMARRLRDALDPARWDHPTRRLIAEFAARRGIAVEAPSVVVEGGVTVHAGRAASRILLVHHSNPLVHTLKRFNAFSNNDIERLGAVLGSPRALAGELARRWGVKPETLRLETLSGLGSSRMSVRDVVRLMRELAASCRRFDLDVRDVLPAAGCDPGTLEQFPRLAKRARGALVAKTGTLTRTDGGIAVLAGVVHTGEGKRLFCIAAPGAGRSLGRARRAQEHWLLELIVRQGGARPAACGREVGYSDDDVLLLPAGADD